ncbi:hypothetical protein V5E97_06750 [Singulisphaera sp. Ch08]|uniref:Uncharacterized protein n=1 Tax=Singulisphaera sp. Ch08 TaxID=3120278 RepID=A0AAU7CL96_9BACT
MSGFTSNAKPVYFAEEERPLTFLIRSSEGDSKCPSMTFAIPGQMLAHITPTRIDLGEGYQPDAMTMELWESLRRSLANRVAKPLGPDV